MRQGQPPAHHGFDCLEAPPLRGLAQARAHLVTHLKRAAIRQLHASAHGERLLLRMYLVGEEATECALLEEWTSQAPPWLAAQIEQHLADERHHAAAFAAALQARGQAVAPTQPGQMAPDWLSRRKIARWRQLGQAHAPQFHHGELVPAYATGLIAEQMAMRVLTRHCAEIGAQHPMHPLLARVLADETRHVRLCQDTLRRLVAPGETAALAALMAKIRAIDAGFGVTGALGMYLAGWFHRLRPSPAQATPT